MDPCGSSRVCSKTGAERAAHFSIRQTPANRVYRADVTLAFCRMKMHPPRIKAAKQGLVSAPTLLSGFLRLVAMVAIFGSAIGAAPIQSIAQDDLSVPGLTDDKEVAKPQAQVSEDGTVTQKDTTLFGLIAKGGWAMVILGGFSFAVIGLAIFCGLDLRKQNFCSPDLCARLQDEWSAGNLEGVTAAVRGNPTTLARMTASVAEHIQEMGYSTDDNDALRGMMAEAGQKVNRSRAKIVNYFSVIAQASPMMGLLGTVSGMIKAFGALGKSGMAKPEVLAEHISEALVTTATGLIIALPAIFLYFFFRDRIEELILECEDFGVDMLNILRRSAFAAAEVAEGGELTAEAANPEEFVEDPSPETGE